MSFESGKVEAIRRAVEKLEKADLVMRCPCIGLPVPANVLFDACIKDVYTAEDVAVLASRICIGLL